MRQRLILAAAILAALGLAWWAHQRHASAVIDRAVLADRAVWQAEAARIRAEATQREIDIQTRAVMAQMEADHAHAQRVAEVTAAAAGARSELDRLRDILATRSTPTDPTDPATSPRTDGAACTERQLLGEGAGHLADLAAEADRLSATLTGLRGYVKAVCSK